MPRMRPRSETGSHGPDQPVTVTSQRAKQQASARKFADRTKAKELVRRRWENEEHNKCVGCGFLIDKGEVSHRFGSGGHTIARRWADDPTLMDVLCCRATWGHVDGCHEAVDRNLNPDLRDRLRWHAIGRFCHAHSLSFAVVPGETPVDAIRRLTRGLEERDGDGAAGG